MLTRTFAVAAVSLAIPLAMHCIGRVRLREESELLRQNVQKIERLEETNARLTRLAGQAKAQSLTDEQLLELMRLRREAGELRGRLKTAQELREENLHLRAGTSVDQHPLDRMSQAQLEQALSAQTVSALKGISLELQAALRTFAVEHTNRAPSDFSELIDHFPSLSRPIVGLHLFEFVRETGPRPDDDLILRETGVRQNQDGKWRRCYAFADGRIAEVISEDGEFDDWEQAHLSPSSPTSR